MSPAEPDRPYAAIFLSEESHQELLRWWNDVVGPPLLSLVFAHHVTLVYDPSAAQLEQITLGTEGEVQVIGWGQGFPGSRRMTAVNSGFESALPGCRFEPTRLARTVRMHSSPPHP